MGIDELPPLVTPRMLSELTGEHVGSITRGIREGRIPADKVNGRWLIPIDDVLPHARRSVRTTHRMKGHRRDRD
jgi:hypothetical protein